MANILVGTSSGATPAQVGVDSTSAEAVAENYSRVGLVMTNLSDSTMYIAFGSNTAVLGSGIPLLPGGGNFSMDEYVYTKEAINAISHSDNSLLAVQEFVVRS